MPRITAAERKRREAEAHDRAVFATLSWPTEPCPQPYSKERMDELLYDVAFRDMTRAWTYNTYSKSVTHGAFGKIYHVREGDGFGDRMCCSQTQGGPWFATEAEARLAIRWAVCREMAETLHRLINQEATAIVGDGRGATA